MSNPLLEILSDGPMPPRSASFQVRCLTNPSPEQLDAVEAYVKPRIQRWEAELDLLPETHVVAGMQIAVERRVEE